MFGLINFANVLPLKYFFKKGAFTSYFKSAINYHSATPSQLNAALAKRRINSTISSSIISAKSCYHNAPVGICASSAVLSVLCDLSSADGKDEQSATSNALAKVLNLRGRVIIGDRALKFYSDRGLLGEQMRTKASILRPSCIRHNYINNKSIQAFSATTGDFALRDMCTQWAAQSGLPFVFARFSSFAPKPSAWLKAFAQASNTPNKRCKIPHYALQKEANARELSPAEIKEYLKFIYYKIGKKEQIALNLYLSKLRKRPICSTFRDFVKK